MSGTSQELAYTIAYFLFAYTFYRLSLLLKYSNNMIFSNFIRLNLRKNLRYFYQLSSQKKMVTKNEQILKNSLLLFSNKTRSQKQFSENHIKLLKIGAVFMTGGLAYFLYNLKNNENTIEENINLDLNEIYESCAVLFLSNPEVKILFEK